MSLSQSVTVFQAGNPVVFPNTLNQPILRIYITTGATATAISNFIFNTSGSTNPLFDIVMSKLYYSGSDSIFNTMNVQLMDTVVNPWATNFSFNPSLQNLAAGDHYFWLTYDVAATAIVCDTLDAEFLSLNFNNVAFNVGNPAPQGNSVIGTCSTLVMDLNATIKPLLYPNPAVDKINVKFDSVPVELLRVYNLLGVLVDEIEVASSGAFSLDVSHFIPGLYLMQLVSDTGTYEERFQVIAD